MAQRFTLTLVSLMALTACTQPAVTVENRGSGSYTRGGSIYASNNTVTAAPVDSVSSSDNGHYVGAKPVYNASREQDQQVASSGGIAVNDLQPAAGKPTKEVVINNQKTPATMPFGKPTPAPVQSATIETQEIQETEEAAAEEEQTKETAHAPTKPVTLSSDAAPVNQWTKKPRAQAAAEPQQASAEITKPAKDTAYIWPVSSHDVTASFGNKGGGKVNDGIQIAAGEGEPVWASADGEVVYADKKMKGYGNMVIVKHAGGKTTTYAHLARMGVDKYDRVKQGDIIGYVGSTGNVKGSQLYFSMRDGSTAIDPQKYLDRNLAGL